MHVDDLAIGDGAHGQVAAIGLRRLDVQAVVPGEPQAQRKGAFRSARAAQARERLRHRDVEPGVFAELGSIGQERRADDHWASLRGRREKPRPDGKAG